MEMDLELPFEGTPKAPNNGEQGRNPNQAMDVWAKFLDQCLTQRIDEDVFASKVSVLSARNPIPPSAVADILLRPQPANRESLDPRVPRYMHVLIERKLIDTPSLLNALYKYSTSHNQAEAVAGQHLSAASLAEHAPAGMRWKSSYGQEETIFYRLTKANGMGTCVRSARESLEVCKAIAKWMVLFTSAAAAFSQEMMGHLHLAESRDDMETSRAAFVMLLLGVCENQVVLKALSQPFAQDARKALSESLASFVPSIMQNASQIAARLEFFRTETLASFEPADKKKEAASAELDDILDSTMGLDNFVIPEIPISNSRAGLYIYLNACLVGRSLIDDAAFYSYLHNRYDGDIQTTTIDLILASFDVLANAVFRNEGQRTTHLMRSYLTNKLPILLATLATSMFPPVTSQFCITEALSHVDTNAFPTLSAMFEVTNSNNAFTDSVRQDFCFACCLHGLIPESAIEGLLGEITYQTLPAGGRYNKETLVQQCMTDPERVQGLVGELDNMDGNVGAVCQALTEVIVRLCHSKETMSLKQLCAQLAKKPLALDVILLFEKPIVFLHPICELLDNWRYDDDQGEYQPVYEEFGSILLLVLAFSSRYNLSAADLGVRSPDSFIAKLLSGGTMSKPLEDLSEQQKSHLGGWIQGLFDNESGGLGDELMSSCPPQDFYLLVSTLFYQTVLALSTDRLSEDSLKSGVEFLVDTFLLPSLVLAISYMSNQLRTTRSQEQKAVIRILNLILLTKQGSNEAQSLLSAVLNLVAKPLDHSLRSYQRQNPSSQEVEPLLKAIKDNVKVSRRTGGADHKEIEQWTSSTQNVSLVASLRQVLQGFVQWGMNPGMNIMPTSYTHRQMLVALKILGPKRFVQVVLEEVKQQTEAGSASIVYDVATALVCAPDVTNIPPPPPPPPALLGDPTHQMSPPLQTRVSLRQALRWEAEDFKKIQKSDAVMAEHVVRLYRRAETQMVMPEPPQMSLQNDLSLGIDESAAASLGDALAAAENQGLGVGVGADDANAAHMDLDLGGPGDMNLDMTSTGSGGLGVSDDDIFGNLGSLGNGTDLDLGGWDSMDLT
ncbi:Mediator of RNA polymerase II transcription subunit 5 [Apiospora saccharicola]|uniref:Mediator of RNA polymerase II transcription subunit 5 n=1 Tax=Apiospora saccharicola TaxID=335842 RepID=A0ABR1TM59_9PEZI